MDILIIEDSSKVTYGGGQRMTEFTINALAEDHNIFLIDFRNDSLVYKNTKEKINGFLRLRSFGKIAGNSSSYNIGILETLTFPFIFLFNLPCFLSWYKKVGSPTLVYCATKKAFLYGAFLKLLNGSRLIFHCHHASPQTSLFAKTFDRLICLLSNLIICVSKYVTIQFPNCKNLCIIYNCSDISQNFGSRTFNGGKRIGFVGNIVPLKGVDLFFKIAKSFKKKPDYKFNIFGRNLINIEIPEGIEYKGFCSREEIYNSIDILLVCSREPEAFSLTPLEAQSFGIPVIVPHFGSFPECIDQGVSGFLYRTPEEIENFILLLSDPDTYQEFSKKAVQKSQQFSKMEFENKMKDLFKN